MGEFDTNSDGSPREAQVIGEFGANLDDFSREMAIEQKRTPLRVGTC